MVSVASGGAADRIAARILFKVPRAGSGTPARYSSTFLGAPLPFAAELRLPDFTVFMHAMLQEAPIQVYASARRADVRHENCRSVYRHLALARMIVFIRRWEAWWSPRKRAFPNCRKSFRVVLQSAARHRNIQAVP